MIIKELYRTKSETGGSIVSPEKPEHDNYEILYRIIAEEGKVLTLDGEDTYVCLDVEVVDEGWYEIEAPEDDFDFIEEIE